MSQLFLNLTSRSGIVRVCTLNDKCMGGLKVLIFFFWNAFVVVLNPTLILNILIYGRLLICTIYHGKCLETLQVLFFCWYLSLVCSSVHITYSVRDGIVNFCSTKASLKILEFITLFVKICRIISKIVCEISIFDFFFCFFFPSLTLWICRVRNNQSGRNQYQIVGNRIAYNCC